MLARYYAGLSGIDSRHERGVRSLGPRQTPLARWVNDKQVAGAVMFGSALHCNRFRKIGSERAESAIGMHCAVAVHTENVVLSVASSSDENVTARTIDEQPGRRLGAKLLAENADCAARSAIRTAAHGAGETCG